MYKKIIIILFTFSICATVLACNHSVPSADRLERERYKIGERVADIRGWENVSEEEVKYTTYNREELNEFIQEELSNEQSMKDLKSIEVIYKTFDLMETSSSLAQVYEEFLSDQILGFYDPDTKEFTVIQEEEPTWNSNDMVTFVHEYVHLLQDHHFDLNNLRPDDSSTDYANAVTALVEGDAVVLETIYTARFLNSNVPFDNRPSNGEDELTVPEIVLFIETWSYIAGSEFVDFLGNEGKGYDLINKAYEDPPVSTEQVIMPQKYLDAEKPVTISIQQDVLGTEWQVIDEDVLGHLYLGAIPLFMYYDPIYGRNDAYFARFSLGTPSQDIVVGWNGDTVITAENDAGESALAGVIAWDEDSDADEFVDGFEGIVNTNPEFSKLENTDGISLWEGPIGVVGFTTFEHPSYGKLVIYAALPTQQQVLDTISNLKSTATIK